MLSLCDAPGATRFPRDDGPGDLEALLSHSPSPRATLGLVPDFRALALRRGQEFVLLQDVFDVRIMGARRHRG